MSRICRSRRLKPVNAIQPPDAVFLAYAKNLALAMTDVNHLWRGRERFFYPEASRSRLNGLRPKPHGVVMREGVQSVKRSRCRPFDSQAFDAGRGQDRINFTRRAARVADPRDFHRHGSRRITGI